MPTFNKYMHLERFGTNAVDGIEVGECHIFPKLDGTNAHVWLGSEGQICSGSRNRELSLDSDNAGFHSYISNHEGLHVALKDNPNLTFYGEWLVPHTLKSYRDCSWREFYIFDVFDNSTESYLSYEAYKPLLEEYNLEYVPCIGVVKDGTLEVFKGFLERNTYLISEGGGLGEGLVIKNYNWTNKFGKVVWAKIITNTFKDKHTKVMGVGLTKVASIESDIVSEFVTEHLVEKSYAKICNDTGWTSKSIPRLFGMVYYDLITEEMWEVLKHYKNPIIDFSRLNKLTVAKVKEIKSDLI